MNTQKALLSDIHGTLREILVELKYHNEREIRRIKRDVSKGDSTTNLGG